MAAENNDSRRTFTAGGETYEYPDPFDLDLDEWVIIYDETGLILEDFAPFDDKKREATRIQQLRNPALIKALAICGLMRAKKELDLDAARELTGSMRMLTVLESLASGDQEAAEEADPPTGGLPNNESEPDNRSQRKSDDTSESTSAASPSSSDEPVEEPVATGTGG